LSYLVDTNVVSELRKGDRADAAVRSWFEAVADEEIFLSVLTIGEIRQGVERIRRRDPAAALALDSWVGRVVETHRDRLVPIDRLVAEEWGRINGPDPLPVVDGLLAATANVVGLTLATRNVGDFERIGVDFVDPFAA
jgi:predicted nucleic acid-binding protein